MKLVKMTYLSLQNIMSSNWYLYCYNKKLMFHLNSFFL